MSNPQLPTVNVRVLFLGFVDVRRDNFLLHHSTTKFAKYAEKCGGWGSLIQNFTAETQNR